MRKLVCLAGILCQFAFGAVVSVRIIERTDVDGGKTFGPIGAYERILAKAYFAVDPKAPANGRIADLQNAPRNAQGLVEFSSDVLLIRPKQINNGNGTALVEIPNRGGGGNVGMLQGPGNLLFEQGFTVVSAGWQFDVPRQANKLALDAPVATKDGKPIRGLVRGQFIPDARVTRFVVSDRNHIPYEAADGNDSSARLLVRDKPDSAPRTISRKDWQFADASHVEYTKGFEPGKIYEVVYTAENPPVAGLGPAAVRDFVSFLKYGGGDSVLGDQNLKRTIGYGVSQSGRFLRTFLYDGFNADEQGRTIFDGVWAHVGGAGRGSFNLRFAQPSRDGHPFLNLFYPTDVFPFTDLPEDDPAGGERAGLLDRVDAKNMPKIFYTNGSYEYWGRNASLIHSSADGLKDAPLAPNTRVYFIAGTQHGANAAPVKKDTQNLANPNDYGLAMRALLLAMQSWITDGTEPPESQYPRAGKDQLVKVGAVQFPKIGGVAFPKASGAAYPMDFSTEPPRLGKPYATLVPQVDRDGNETTGIRLPEVAVPLGTYTGWNLREARIGAPDQLYSMVGSFVPFARTKAERLKSGDPRLSIEERYTGREDYLKRVEKAADELVQSRFLLPADATLARTKAAARWDSLMGMAAGGC